MKPDNVTPFEYRKFKMTLQDRVQAKAFYKQTSSYTHSVFPGRFFPSALASVQQHSAFLGQKVLCTQHLGLLGKAVLPIKSETQLNSSAQGSSELPFPSEESSHLLDKGKRHANNSMEANWLPCWIAATIQAEHTENMPRTKLHPPQQGDLAAGTGLHVLQNPWILGRRRHTPENMDIRQPSNAKYFVYFLLSWVIPRHSGL